MAGTGKRGLIYWFCQIGGWFSVTEIALAFVLYSSPRDVAPWQLAITYNAGAALAVAWTHLYRGHIRRRQWAALSPARLLVRVLGGSAVLGAAIPLSAYPVWLFVLRDRVDPIAAWGPPAFMTWSWCVLMWSVIYFGVHYFERWRQAEVDKLRLAVAAAEARLEGLMSQLNPHFLFNCLNSVRALIVEDQGKAQTTVTELSNLMRYSMQAGRIPTVPLEVEIDMVRTYLSLEGVRLDERLTTRIEIAPETRSVPVPTMLVQLLVENGVKHGIERLADGGAIEVAARIEDGALRVRVTSSGRIVASDGSTRVGLANARERLRLLYGAAASLALREDGGSVVAELSLPVTRGRA
ncbi:MAG TPA: histidine kinase [Kofleriaceae bacterium]|nr:histidine kinase [Kofleriaceae bacterium]